MEPKTVLIAEDDEDNFFFLKVSLRTEKFNILRARNGREAVDIIRSNPDIILILMDLKMPGMDGFEATKAIKVMRPDIPILAVTAYAMTGDEIKTLEAGCDGYIAKPFTREQMLELIGQYINIQPD
jgi:CheY-like chemotaxis protein